PHGDDGGNATATEEATSEDGGDGDADATDTLEDGEEDPTEEDGDGGSSGSSDVPLPDGANEESSLTYSGSQLPFPIPSESGVDASTFGELTVKTYTVDGSPEDIVDFYKDNQGDWEEAYGVTTSEGGLLLWTMDDGQQAAWIVTAPGSEDGTTSLTVASGHAE
ncbi:MAG: hypothetical protein WEE64_10245, partial [Dehalococcoidia bacterium]